MLVKVMMERRFDQFAEMLERFAVVQFERRVVTEQADKIRLANRNEVLARASGLIVRQLACGRSGSLLAWQ
jgi:hypothetical protein